MAPKSLTARNTVAEWLADPVGGTLFRELLARAGRDESVLAPARNLPLQALVQLGGGALPQEAVDALVLGANGGVAPPPETAEEVVASRRFADRTVIVTGAANGIGRATAMRILADGGRVVAVDVTADRLAAFAATHDLIVPVVADITTGEGIDAILAAADGTIDGLANVAGIMDQMTPLHEVDDTLWRRVFAVNVDGLFALSRAVILRMLESGGGSIVNVASEASLRGNAAGTAYTASKHAVAGITKSAAFLYGPSGIRVNAVAPGPTATGIEGSFSSDFGRGRLGPFLAQIPPVVMPDVMASSITWLLSDDAANINGVILASDGGWSVQ